MATADAPTCRLFLSWSSRDSRLKQELVDDRLLHHLSNFGDVNFEWWEYSLLQAGDQVDPSIARGVAEADLGVLLLSPPYFSSSYIRNKELPFLLKPTNRVVPAALRIFGQFEEAMDLAGIERQWVHYERDKPFAELRHADKDRFALAFALGIRRRFLGLGGWRSL